MKGKGGGKVGKVKEEGLAIWVGHIPQMSHDTTLNATTCDMALAIKTMENSIADLPNALSQMYNNFRWHGRRI